MKTIKQSSKSLLEATKYKLYVDNDILKTIPRSSGTEVVEVFTVGKYLTNEELKKEYENRGLKPASLDAILTVKSNHDYIATIWDNKSYAAFSRWYDVERGVVVSRRGNDWHGRWFFAGVRKSSALKTSALPLETKNLEIRVEQLEKALKSVVKVLSTL